MIKLGFELGSGSPVNIPLGHMVIVGQTQRAGKTTALEACAQRSGKKTVAFLTKRGEGSFRLGMDLPPYYEDYVDWRIVRSLCEAVIEPEKWSSYQRQVLRVLCEDGDLGTKNRVEWKKPTTMEELRANLTVAMSKAPSKMKLTMVEIRSDLAAVHRELDKLKAQCSEPHLKIGLNVVNLEQHKKPIQAMVVSSFIRWIREKAENTVVALPEAWKFAPGRRRTPVGDEAQEFIREGAALENFLWIDSQTIGGLNSELLAQVRVWLFGVQRLRSEIEKTLDAIPDSIDPRPRAAEIATLGKGEFIACYDQEMYRVYVWPAWMRSALHAEAIARGEESVESARQIAEEFDEERIPDANIHHG